jgi:hypothetical protein
MQKLKNNKNKDKNENKVDNWKNSKEAEVKHEIITILGHKKQIIDMKARDFCEVEYSFQKKIENVECNETF